MPFIHTLNLRPTGSESTEDLRATTAFVPHCCAILQDELSSGKSLKVPSSAPPQTREFFHRMSADGVSPASVRAARISETDLQEADGQEAQPAVLGLGRRIRKVRTADFWPRIMLAIIFSEVSIAVNLQHGQLGPA